MWTSRWSVVPSSRIRPLRVRTIAPSPASARAQVVGVVVAGDEHERLAAARDALDEARLELAAAVGQVADEEHRAAVGEPLEHAEPDRVVVQVGRDRDHRLVGEAAPPAGGDDEAGEADQLRVELLVEDAARPARRLDGLERSRDVRAVGVVLRVGDLARAAGSATTSATPMPRLVTIASRLVHRRRGTRERIAKATSRPSSERRGDDQRDQLAQVVRERVAGLAADLLDVERLALGERLGDGAVDRLQVDADAERRADRLEARAPVHQRHVDVQRALVARVDRHPDLADA